MSVIRFKPVVAAVFIQMVFAASAFADKITISGDSAYRQGSGGEFNVRAADAGGQTLLGALSSGYVTVDGTVVGTADGTLMNPGFGGLVGFQSFCLEFNEFITLPGDYLAAISVGAMAGGVNGATDGVDMISIGTAYLYSQFATGALQGYGTPSAGGYLAGPTRATSAEMLQQAFWYLEDEISLTDAQKTANVFLTGTSGAITLFGDGTGVGVGGAKADSNGAYNVKVLNLTTLAGAPAQDQLIMVVPDGGLTIALLGLGVGGLALLRRRVA